MKDLVIIGAGPGGFDTAFKVVFYLGFFKNGF